MIIESRLHGKNVRKKKQYEQSMTTTKYIVA